MLLTAEGGRRRMCIFAFIIMGTVREKCCTETDKVEKGKPKDGDNF